MDMTPPTTLAAILTRLDNIILDKQHVTRLALACLLARGHLLLEDLPGMGKTVLAHGLAQTLGLAFSRVQFTNDLLPADLLGGNIVDRASGGFTYHPGPVFSQVLLADEINRASPKTQSALLEAMEERQVSSDGVTRKLPEPFFVIATQNPLDQQGVFPLPESQLDRFLMRLSLGYPGRSAELEILRGEDRRRLLESLAPLLDAIALGKLQQAAAAVHAAEPLIAYLHALGDHSRNCGEFRYGLSTRALQGLLRAAKSWALIDGRNTVIPSDVQAVFPAVAGHRLPVHNAQGQAAARQILEQVAIP